MVVQHQTEIDGLRAAGKLAARVLDMIGPHVVADVTTEELNTLCHDFILANNAIPAPLNYRGFPKSICTSVNHVVCHGIPDTKKLRDRDILNIDVTVILDGWFGDTSRMYCVGEPAIQAKRLIDVTREALRLGIETVRPGNTLGDIGAVVQRHIESNRFSVVRDFCGHGIGRSFHEPPQVLHYGTPGTGMILQPGQVFTIEPMANLGQAGVKVLRDNWTAVTRDRTLSAQWEHQIIVTEDGAEILTLS